MDINNFKITHYLNKRLKESKRNGILEYPVYVRVSYGRKNERVKSAWIVHPCSEYDFENNKYILELKQYENEIIRDILKRHDDEHFILSTRLRWSQTKLTGIFLGCMFEKYEINKQIISFVSKKTGINESIFYRYLINELDSKKWIELYEKDIFTTETKEKVMYLSMLLKFEENNYPRLPENVFGFRAGCEFVFHEWKNKNKKTMFLKFAENENILEKYILIKLTNDFEDKIQEYSTFDVTLADAM